MPRTGRSTLDDLAAQFSAPRRRRPRRRLARAYDTGAPIDLRYSPAVYRVPPRLAGGMTADAGSARSVAPSPAPAVPSPGAAGPCVDCASKAAAPGPAPPAPSPIVAPSPGPPPPGVTLQPPGPAASPAPAGGAGPDAAAPPSAPSGPSSSAPSSPPSGSPPGSPAAGDTETAGGSGPRYTAHDDDEAVAAAFADDLRSILASAQEAQDPRRDEFLSEARAQARTRDEDEEERLEEEEEERREEEDETGGSHARSLGHDVFDRLAFANQFDVGPVKVDLSQQFDVFDEEADRQRRRDAERRARAMSAPPGPTRMDTVEDLARMSGAASAPPPPPAAFGTGGLARAAEATTTDPCEPLYEPAKWNTPSVQPRNNCYNYATDIITNTFAQPGRGGTVSANLTTCTGATAGALADGLENTTEAHGCTDIGCGHVAALVIWPGQDFHWYRRDRYGKWSHKPGSTPARNTDNSGREITNPETCDRGPYTQFCGYFCVCKDRVKIA